MAVPQVAVHRRLEEPDHQAPFGFGAVERGVGIAEERGRIAAVPRIDRSPDAQSDANALPLDLERVRYDLEQAFGLCGGGRRLLVRR
jgi:hypothetical protein